MVKYLVSAIIVLMLSLGFAVAGASQDAPLASPEAPEKAVTEEVEDYIEEQEEPQEIESEAVAPQKVSHKENKPITWWCGRCGKGYTDDTPRGECPDCKHIKVITCECGFQYYEYDIDGNKAVCPECEMRAWEEKQKHKEEPPQVEPVEEPTEEQDQTVEPDYDSEVEDGDYCEAREHYNDNGNHKVDTGCKYEEKHPEECES